MTKIDRFSKLCFQQEGPVLSAGITHLALHGQKSSKVKRFYAPNKKSLVDFLCRSTRPLKVRVALTHVTAEWSHAVWVAHSTSNTWPLPILLICDHFLYAIRAWHQSIHHYVTACCLHSDTDITLQWVGVKQASFHASPAYCCECNLSLVWVMMAVKLPSQPLLGFTLFCFFEFQQIAFKTLVYSIACNKSVS